MIPALDELRAITNAATPGPWKWGGYVGRMVDLRSMTSGVPFVMTFKRLGMQGAEPCFAVGRRREEPSRCWSKPHWTGGILTPASKLAVREVDYRDDIAEIDNPDALFIATFNPRTVGELLDRLEQAERALGAREGAVS